MGSTHTLNTIIAAGTACVPGAPQVGTAFANTAGYGAFITGLITNGPTGPTIQVIAYVEASGDNVNWKEVYRIGGGTIANDVIPISYNVSAKIMNYRVRFAGNTGQNVTVEAFAHALTTV
jgi:hypothetical protein